MVTELPMAVDSLCCWQLTKLTIMSLSSHSVVTVISRWLMEKEFSVYHELTGLNWEDRYNALNFQNNRWKLIMPSFIKLISLKCIHHFVEVFWYQLKVLWVYYHFTQTEYCLSILWKPFFRKAIYSISVYKLYIIIICQSMIFRPR